MNINTIIGDSKNREVIIKSFLWNTIIEIFNNKKQIDISSYLVSLRISGTSFFIKTNNPLVNGELILLENEIKDLFLDKLKKVGIKYEEIVFIYK